MSTWAKALNEMVGERLKKLRHRASPGPLTQLELAKRTNGALSRSSIASLERGFQGISLVQLYILAQALDVEPTQLLPSRGEVLTTDVEKLLRSSTPRVAEFISKVRETPTPKKGGQRA